MTSWVWGQLLGLYFQVFGGIEVLGTWVPPTGSQSLCLSPEGQQMPMPWEMRAVHAPEGRRRGRMLLLPLFVVEEVDSILEGKAVAGILTAQVHPLQLLNLA